MTDNVSLVPALAFSPVAVGHRSISGCGATHIVPAEGILIAPILASSSMQASGRTRCHRRRCPVTKIKVGFNALRATMRAATGISLTAMYLSFVAFTSGLVRGRMTFVLAIFPTWVSVSNVGFVFGERFAYICVLALVVSAAHAISLTSLALDLFQHSSRTFFSHSYHLLRSYMLRTWTSPKSARNDVPCTRR
jgi:hypothetical protein